jgi:Flp pilus assembly protein TadG
MRQASWRRLRAFARDAKGNVAILFGLALIPMLIGVGVAIDYGRALIIRDRMADAADAAALAIGSWPNQTPDELKTRAQQFFNANYPPSTLGTVGALDVQVTDDNIFVTVKGTMQTTFMKLANIDSLNVGASTTVAKKERNIELALVLDITGSMNQGGKLSAMKSAATKMVSTLFDGKETSDTLKIAVVPFSVAVNIGSDKLNSGWLDKNTYSAANAAADPIAFEDYNSNGISNLSALNLYTKVGKSWSGCVRERGDAYELTDDPPSSGTPATQFVPYFAPDEPDSASGTSYSNTYLGDGSYSSATCIKTASSSNDNKRQCNTAKYKSFSSSGGPYYNCPPAASKVLALTNTQSTITSAINSLAANGNTVIPAGLLWGWRTLSPTAPFTEGAAYDDEKWVKALVLLTDGENDVSGGGNGMDKSVYNAFGYAKNGHLGSTSGSNAEATLDSKTLSVCSAIKAKGILLYTIGFQVTSASKSLLTSCATKPDMFYDSPTNDQLAAIFQDIAQGLNELRIAQ